MYYTAISHFYYTTNHTIIFFSFFTNFIPINFFYFLFLKKYTFRLHFSTIQKLFCHTPYSCTFRKFLPYTFSTILKIRHTPLGKFSPYTFSTILKICHTPLGKFSPYTFSTILKIRHTPLIKFSPNTFNTIPKNRTYTFRKIFIIHLKYIPKFSPYIISKI